MPPPPWTEPAMPPAPGPGPDAPPPPGPGPDVPPPPAWFGPAPSPLALMVPVHAAPNKTAMASPAQPRARCCAAREPTSRREHDDGSLVQLTSFFLSEESARCSTASNKETSGREWHGQLIGNRPGQNSSSREHCAARCLFVKFLLRIRAGQFFGPEPNAKSTALATDGFLARLDRGQLTENDFLSAGMLAGGLSG